MSRKGYIAVLREHLVVLDGKVTCRLHEMMTNIRKNVTNGQREGGGTWPSSMSYRIVTNSRCLKHIRVIYIFKLWLYYQGYREDKIFYTKHVD